MILPLLITKQAFDDFERAGLAAMDETLFRLSERLTPANAPHMRPNPLDLVGQMMLDGFANGHTQKLMVCALWLAHHYRSLEGMNIQGPAFSFTWNDSVSRRPAATA